VSLAEDLEALLIAGANAVLGTRPDPVVELRVRRDVLGSLERSAEIKKLKVQIDETEWVKSLADEQRPDGSWGRLHSEDTSQRQRHPTTEFAVRRAVALGLTNEHPVLCLARDHLANVITSGNCADPPEKNDRWPTGVRLFAASTLSRYDADHAAVVSYWHLWCEIAELAFATGSYDPDREAAAHHELTGASVRDSYLRLDNRYALELLTSRGHVDAKVGRGLAAWLLGSREGIRYLSVPLLRPLFGSPSGTDRWLTSLDIILGLPLTAEQLQCLLTPLIGQRGDDGLWDLGLRPVRSEALPLSDNWRSRRKRTADWSTRVLLTLAKAESVAKSL